MKTTVRAYAKINIFLDILGKLDNGYHSLFMVMQSVGLYDLVTIEETDKNIELTCSEPDIPCNEKNTAYKAAKIFFEKTGIEKGAKIHIKKQIPHEAGLAGGSADAAAVLVGLNKILGTGFSVLDLCEMGLKVGSDVPFCIVGGMCLAQNTGGVLSPLRPISNCTIVLAKPDKGVSTAKAYADADDTYIYHPDCMHMLDACENGDFKAMCKYAGNVFEQVVEVPERVEIKRIMRENHCSLTQMSGSGPTVFGIFENDADAINAAEKIKKICKKVFVTKSVAFGTKTE